MNAGQPGPSAAAQPQGQTGGGTFTGPGLEAVNAIVSQVVGGLLGPTAAHGSQPASPRTPHRRRRTAPPLNGLLALHGYLSRLSDLQSLDDPPAMLPVVRNGLPDSHRSWNSVTSATTAILNSNRQRHGSLHDALIMATGDENLTPATVEQLDALLRRAVAQQQQPQQDEGITSTQPGPGPGASSPATEPTSSQTEAAPSDTYEFMQLIVLAYALTMAQAAESMRIFETNFTERAAALVSDVLLDIETGSTTFERSQVCYAVLDTGFPVCLPCRHSAAAPAVHLQCVHKLTNECKCSFIWSGSAPQRIACQVWQWSLRTSVDCSRTLSVEITAC